MRRYTVVINNIEHVIDVEETAADSFRVQLGGQDIEVRLTDHQDLAQAAITPEVETRGRTIVAAPSYTPVTRSAPAAASAAPAAAAAAPVASPRPAGGGGPGAMTAPMPGVVLSIETSVGAQVKRGDTLLVLEAMKMKNALKATKDGTVTEIYVSAGQQVGHGEALLKLEG